MRRNQKAKGFKEFEAELLKNPEIRKEYNALKPKYMTIKQEMESQRRLKDGKTNSR